MTLKIKTSFTGMPMQHTRTPMITNQRLGMFLFRQEALLRGNQRNRPLLPYPPRNRNMSHYPKLDARRLGLEIYMLNWDSLKGHLLLYGATMRDQ